jgi:hypothetical protein
MRFVRVAALALFLAGAACGSDDEGVRTGSAFPGPTTDTDPPPSPGPCEGDAIKPGCPCDEEDEGVFEPCGRVVVEIAGQESCGDGQTVCENGEWGECIINNSTPPTH